MKRELKSFEELAGPINQEEDLKFYYHLAELAKEVSQEKEIFGADELPDCPEVSDEEVDIRVTTVSYTHLTLPTILLV